MNMHFKEVFTGKVVNKKLTFNTGMDEFPRYVLEYLIDNYCEEDTPDCPYYCSKQMENWACLPQKYNPEYQDYVFIIE